MRAIDNLVRQDDIEHARTLNAAHSLRVHKTDGKCAVGADGLFFIAMRASHRAREFSGRWLFHEEAPSDRGFRKMAGVETAG